MKKGATMDFNNPEAFTKLIETCSKYGVTRFISKNFTLEFGGKVIPSLAPKPTAVEIAEADKKADDVEKEELLVTEQKTKQDLLDEMLVSDPEEYERLVVLGELVDGDEAKVHA